VLEESVLVREVSSVAAGELVGFGESVGARVFLQTQANNHHLVQ